MGARDPTGASSSTSTAPASSTASSTSGPPGGGELIGDEGGLPFNTCKRQPRGAKFRITLPKETELADLVNWMMSISCQKFIWDPKVRGTKVTILSPEPVTVREAYAAFYAALETMGLTVEPSGEYFKIVETNDAKSKTLPMYDDGKDAPNSDRFVTQLARVKHGNVDEIAKALGNLKSKQGSIDSVGNLLIMTDKGSSIRRLMRIIEELDQEGMTGEKIFFYQLQYASAEEVADIIREIFGEKQAASKSKSTKSKKSASPTDLTFSRVIVDERTSTLIIVTSESDYIVISRLIKQLDVKLPGGGGRLHVKPLKNADAVEVAKVLSQLAAGAKSSGGNSGGKNSGGNGGNQGAAALSAELFSGDVKITADQATRSLVIVASQTDYEALEPVIDQLDSERRQLYIEIYLLEVKLGRNLTAGASGHFGGAFETSVGDATGNSIAMGASIPSSDINSLAINPAAVQGLAGAILGPPIPGSAQYLGTPQDVPAFGVILQALQSNDDVNVVSEPHMYAADNQEALIEIGRQVPTQGALSFSGAGGVQGNSLVPLQGIERIDVTLKITLKPYVNDHETVTLDVDIEDRDIESQDPRLGVTTTKRRLKLDKIVGRDGQPVVLGGLIREREVENVQQVPGLGSIPLLGWLFKRKQRIKEKVNLLVVMIPHILETPDDVRRIHERRDRERLEFIERETNFKPHELPRTVNFRKKSGLLTAIDREARQMEVAEERRRAAEEELRTEIITGEIGLSPKVLGDESEEDSSSASAVTLKPQARGGSKKK
ncbi:MAG: type II secretion system secretin GspD [Myxococcales bacterium]|nr:type II secretion system secretin GspD [Myxococcales bacterium]